MEDTWIAWSDSHGLPWMTGFPQISARAYRASRMVSPHVFFLDIGPPRPYNNGEIDPLASMELKPAVAVLISLSFVAGTLEPSNGFV